MICITMIANIKAYNALVNLSTLNGPNSFKINGNNLGDLMQCSHTAGDINKNGFSNIIIGAPYS